MSYCGVIEVRSLEDALGATCARSATAQCSDCGTVLCDAHAEGCELCSETFCPGCVSFIGPSIPGLPSPTSSRNHRGRKRRSITRQGYMRLICWTGGSGSLQRVRISMVSSATILVVLVVLFLVSIKWTIDVIGGWPHKIPISRYLEQQRSRPVTANRQTGGDSFLASVLA